MPIPGLNRAVVQAINVGRSISDDVRAVYITDDPEEAAELRADFERQVPGVPLVVVESPYRTLVGPLLAYLDVLDAAWPPDKPSPITFVVIPEYVARSWWERILYNQSAKRLRTVAARTAAHGRRRRPVPARGPGAVRGGARRRAPRAPSPERPAPPPRPPQAPPPPAPPPSSPASPTDAPRLDRPSSDAA